MVGVPLDLGGATHVALDENALGVTAVGDRRGEVQRTPGDHVLGRPHVGDDGLGGLLRACGQPREGERRAHHAHELAAAGGIRELGGLLRELAVEELEEARCLLELLEALPEPAPTAAVEASPHPDEVDGHGRDFRIGAHRWHVEQVVRVWTAYCFTRSRPFSSWSAGAFQAMLKTSAFGLKIALRVAVAVEAPLHLEGLFLPCEGHLIDTAVAGRAPDALVHVCAVVEVDEIGQVVDPRPFDGLVGPEARPHRLEGRALAPDLGMAVHARLGGWDAGVRGPLHRRVAVAAVDPEPADVVRVAERHGLRPRLVGTRHVGGPVDLEEHPDQSGDEKQSAEDAELGKAVRAAVKDLSHLLPAFSAAR